MDSLLYRLQQIKDGKDTNILPENIKKGITVFGVTGEIQEGVLTQEEYDQALATTNQILNSEYHTYLEYIESTGTQYINTNFKPSSDFKIVIEASIPTTDDANFSHSYNFGIRYANNQYRLRFTSTGTTTDTGVAATLNTKTKLALSKDGFYINDSFTKSLSGDIFNGSTPLAICAYSANGIINDLSAIRVYSYQLYTGGTLILDLKPVIRALDGAICMYDLVTNKYFLNGGTGEFIAGPVKEM